MASRIERLFTPHTPWLARLSRRRYWMVVSGFALLFGAGAALVVSLLPNESMTTAAVIGIFAAALLIIAGVLLRGELRTFWPQRD